MLSGVLTTQSVFYTYPTSQQTGNIFFLKEEVPEYTEKEGNGVEEGKQIEKG